METNKPNQTNKTNTNQWALSTHLHERIVDEAELALCGVPWQGNREAHSVLRRGGDLASLRGARRDEAPAAEELLNVVHGQEGGDGGGDDDDRRAEGAAAGGGGVAVRAARRARSAAAPLLLAPPLRAAAVPALSLVPPPCTVAATRHGTLAESDRNEKYEGKEQVKYRW